MIIGAETTAKAETQPRGKIIAYWTVTLLLAAAVMLSGIGQLMQYGGNVELVTNLGYPLYVMTILGIWRGQGVITFAVPGFPRFKNGFTLEITAVHTRRHQSSTTEWRGCCERKQPVAGCV